MGVEHHRRMRRTLSLQRKYKVPPLHPWLVFFPSCCPSLLLREIPPSDMLCSRGKLTTPEKESRTTEPWAEFWGQFFLIHEAKAMALDMHVGMGTWLLRQGLQVMSCNSWITSVITKAHWKQGDTFTGHYLLPAYNESIHENSSEIAQFTLFWQGL